MTDKRYDAIVVGSGPNGFAAAIELARNGHSALVIEGSDTIGGGARSAALTLPGFTHDICSSIHPLGIGSPFFRELPLDKFGLEWVHPDAPLAHPLDDGTAVLLERSVDQTADGLGPDAAAYRKLFTPLTAAFAELVGDLLGPLRLRPPRRPLAALRFGWWALRSGRGFAEDKFEGERARALVAGNAAHSVLPLERPPGAAPTLMLMTAGHAVGWPFPRGGTQRLSDALAGYFRSLGGEIETGRWVKSVEELPPCRVVLLDLTPKQILTVAGHRLSDDYRRQLEKYRYGPAVFKVDWALKAPVPWRAAECRRAATLHLGGTLADVATSERAPWEDRLADRPFVLFAQHTLFDPSRAPPGQHTAWGYCHIPHGSAADMTERIEAQVERFAPGFRDVILARHVFGPAALEQHNPNLVGGDITGGVVDFGQLFTRPAVRFNPYKAADRIYICSSSTPPGPGVHGMCGFFAAQAARVALKATNN